MKRFLIVSAILLTIIGTESCRTTVVERPAEPVAVARPPQPRADYVWISGEWIIVGGRYQYRQGYWAPPRRGHAWVPGHWVRRGHGYYWAHGYWR